MHTNPGSSLSWEMGSEKEVPIILKVKIFLRFTLNCNVNLMTKKEQEQLSLLFAHRGFGPHGLLNNSWSPFRFSSLCLLLKLKLPNKYEKGGIEVD